MSDMEIKKGLEGVVVDVTKLSRVDGLKGQLVYCGYDIDEMAKCTFEEVCYLFLYDKLPSKAELSQFDDRLKASRMIPAAVKNFISQAPLSDHPMSTLRTAVSMLSGYMSDLEDVSDKSKLLEQSITLISQVGSICAYICRAGDKKELVDPRPDLGHSANFLYMINGKEVDDVVSKTLDTALVLHVDHSFNASTFTARAIASTLSDMVSAVTGAIGSLKGPLHGGANTAVMKMLQEIGEVENVPAWLDKALAEKRKVMGFGHRVYKTLDPRAKHLKRMSKEWGQRVGDVKWFTMSEKLEELMAEKKNIKANVDFYSASTYFAMGIQPEHYTLLFAVARIAGWCAHTMEQLADNKLVRPKASYVGDEGKVVKPISDR